MDFIGPINPPCLATGYIYILVVIDYCSRFLWAVGTMKADKVSTMHALLNHVIPIVGWPLTVYSDHESHFTGSLISQMWSDHGVIHFTSAISYPHSVGLSERYVQILIERICLSCISLDTSRYWSKEIHNAVLAINTWCVRLHGYSPAEILLGFNPSTTKRDETGLDAWAKGNLAQEIRDRQSDESELHSFVDQRYEKGIEAGKQLA